MTSPSPSDKTPNSAQTLSVPLQQAMDQLALNLLPGSGPSRAANIPLQSSLAGPGSNLPYSSTSPPAPAIHSTTQSSADRKQKQTQSQEEALVTLQSVATQPYFAHRSIHSILALGANFTTLLIKDWVPHILSPSEVQHYREDIHRRIQKIRDLEVEQSQMVPRRSPPLEQALFMARLDYKVRFSRIFRINDLPPEVLTNIFRYVIWSAVSPDYGVRWRLWVTWVCRHWRATALADPMLWNAIWFKDLPNFERSFAWLERSADAPLDIRINDTKERPISVAMIHNLLKRLFDKMSNIRIFIIILQEWDPILVVLHAFRVVIQEKNPAMTLERFEMHRSGSPYVQLGSGYEPSFYLKPIPLFGGVPLPSFNYLSLNGVHIDWTTSILTNLTTLDIRRIPLDKAPTLSQFRAFLAGSPALRKLFLDGAGPGWSDIARGMKPVHIPSLRILVLGDFSLNYATYVCAQIFAPNVLDLTLMNFVGEDYSRLYDLLRSNMPLVRVLTLYNIDFAPSPRSSTSVIRWLQSMPLLTYFRIGNVKPQFLELFCYHQKTMRSPAEGQLSSENPPCPKLVFLEFEAVQMDVISRWAHARKMLGFPLQKIYISVPVANQVTEEQYQQLAAALDGVGVIQVLSPGCRPVEEVNLIR